MTIYYNGEEQFGIATNHGMTVQEALYSHGIDANDQSDLEAACNKGAEYVYLDDNGNYQIDWDGLTIEA